MASSRRVALDQACRSRFSALRQEVSNPRGGCWHRRGIDVLLVCKAQLRQLLWMPASELTLQVQGSWCWALKMLRAASSS